MLAGPRPLDGFTVGITADRRSDLQGELLRRQGATIIHGPTIRTLPLASEDGLRSATEWLIADPPAYLVANTGLGMRSWFAAAESWGLMDNLLSALAETAIIARGPKAASAIVQAGLAVRARAASERLEEVVAILAAEDVGQRRVAFQRHGANSPTVVEELRALGAEVVELPVYQWRLPEEHSAALKLITATAERRVDAVTFTSAPAVRNMAAIATEAGLLDRLRAAFAAGVIAACVGPVCADAARSEGLGDPLVPDPWRLGPLIRSVSDELATKVRTYRIGDLEVEVRGAVVLAGDKRLELTARERALIDRLARRPGVVVSKCELLRSVWSDCEVEVHAVEGAVARLRRRLGPAGPSIRAVPRRGYSWAGVPVPSVPI